MPNRPVSDTAMGPTSDPPAPSWSPSSPTSASPTPSSSRPRPPLPPRRSSNSGAHATTSFSNNHLGPSMAPASASSGFTADPRSSSSQSLGSSSFGDHSNTASRRTLLVVYIHGFYGNDQSFRSFPAHVHSHLRNALAHSHVVHTKTYPRYKTYRAIEVARDNFSAWLEPHEGPTTDVILVGHSMGGILAGEVVLSPNRHPYSSHPFRHRILGTVSLDSPFLGLHPGIVASGLASLFHPSPTPSPWSEEAADISPTVSNTAASTPLSTNSPQVSQHSSIVPEYADQASFLSPTSSPSTEPRDPLFNPPFFNDNAFKERPFHKRLARFVKKHSSEGIIGAARNHVLSHLEYGGCLADYPALHSRYNKLRALEDVDDLAAFRDHPNDPSAQNSMPARVRFVNYFTVSTGRPKQPQSGTQSGTPSPTDERRSPVDTILPSPAGQTVDLQRGTLRAEDSEGLPRTSGDGVITPKISLDAPDARESLLILDPMPMDQLSSGDELAYSRNQDEGPLHVSSKADNSPDGRVPANAPQEAAQDSGVLAASLERDLDLPPIPDLPVQPTPPDLDSYVDKEARRQAEKEAKKAQKGYEQAVKHRDKVLRQRQQLLDKHRRRTEKEAARQAKQAAKDRVREEKQLAWEEKKSGPQEEKEHDTGPLSLGGAHVDGASSSVALCDGQATGNRPKGERRDSTHRDADAQEMDPRKPTLSPVKRKPPKERKFCVLPRRVGEGRDETWVRVFMEGVDEVGAHCGLFESGPHYDRLVGDVAQRMVDWVQEDLNLAAVRRLAEEGDGDMVGGEK